MLTRSTAASIISPEQVASLITAPLVEQSVALAAATVVSLGSSSLRIPVATSTPTAAWTAEGSEITPSDAGFSEIDITPSALKSLSILSNELAKDSSPAAAGVVGSLILRDLVKQVDAAFFSTATTAPANTPGGLGTLPTTGTGKINVIAGGAITTLDVFTDAILNAEGRYLSAGELTFLAAPATVGALIKLKESSGSARPLISSDVTKPSLRTIAGVPLVATPALGAGVVWCLPKSRVIVAMREDADLEVDGSAFFTSDRTAIRAVQRLGWGFTDVPAITKITLS